MSAAPARSVAGFVRVLRRAGYTVGVRETVDTLSLIAQCDAPRVPTLRAAMRSLFCRDRDEWARFGPIFDRYWLPTTAVRPDESVRAAARIDPRLRHGGDAAGTGLAGAVFSDAGSDDVPEGSAGRQRTLTRTDFRFLTEAGERHVIEQLAERLALRLRKRFVRRRRIASRGRRLHLRRTLRKGIALGGLPVHRRYVVRRRELPPLVLIQDISHSMAPYTPLFTRFVRGLLRVFRDAHAFAFHTELFPVTGLYRETDAHVLRRRLETMSHLWMGGTRIAESLARFNRDHAASTVDARTLVVILSDGFDTDEPTRLAQELGYLKARCGRMIWLDPTRHAGAPESEEDALSPVTAIVDARLPARSLADLAAAIERIAGGGRKRPRLTAAR